MQIILNGADFSANNIGKVVVSNEYYKAAVANYTSMDASTKTALGYFINTLIDNDIMSKISFIHIPKLGSTVSEALFNIADKKKVSVDTEDNLVLSDGFLVKSVAATGTTVTFENGVSLSDISIVYVPNKAYKADGIHRMLLGGNMFEIQNNAGKFGTYVNAPLVRGAVVNSTIKDVEGYSANSDSQTFIGKSCKGNINVSMSGDFSTSSTKYNTLSLGGYVTGSLGDTEITNMLIIGSSLTEDELTTLLQATYDLAYELDIMNLGS